MKTLALLLAAALLLGLAPSLHAQTAVTATTTADSGPGSLRLAITSATGPTTITFAPGLAGPIVLSSEIVIPGGKTITVDASALVGGMVIDGGPGTNRIFSVDVGGTLTLKGLTLTGGNGKGNNTQFNGFGGAIFNNQGSLLLTQCSLSSNSADSGGVIYNFGGSVTLTECSVSNNSAYYGGAIFSYGALALTQCILSDNSAQQGSAIYNYLGTLELTRCSLFGNSADYGGAILNIGLLNLTNCTLSGNSAVNLGGAIYTYGYPLTLTNCTLSGNSASIEGGAIYNASQLTLTNTIVAGNSAPTGPDIRAAGSITTTGKNLIGDLAGSGLTANGTTVLVTTDPKLGPLGNYGGPTPTMLPLPGSPAINPSGGATSSTLTTDQRGSARVFGGSLDIGAVEVGLVVNTTADQLDTPHGPQVSLREAVRDAGPNGMVINFAPSLNDQTITLTPVNGTINLTNNVEINAEGLASGITVNGASQHFRLFYVSPSKTVAMHNLRITNGGGTAFNDFGGGISLDVGGKLTLTRCTLSNNRTSSTQGGGAIEVTTGSVLTMTDCMLSGNQSGFGGAINAVGDAFPSEVATVTLNRCTLSGNQAVSGSGGGLQAYRSSISLTQCTVANNSATGSVASTGWGGGIFCLSSYLTMNHCTIAGNTANGNANNGRGGGVLADGEDTGGFAIANTIITGNAASELGPDMAEGRNVGATVRFTGRVFIGDLGAPGGNGFSASAEVLTTAQNGAVNLAPLGSYGGFTQTMPPLSGSPVIDKASATARVGTAMNVSFPTDQRGAPRAVDGDGNTLIIADLGAAEYVPAQTLEVNTTADSGPGSLRQAIANAAFTTALTTVTFAPALNGQTITLTSGEIAINATGNVTVDASSLTAGLTVSGNNRSRHFTVPAGATLTLRALTLTGGLGFNGGAIFNDGTLALTQCTLSGNFGSLDFSIGGGISNGGTLSLTQCTLSGNSAHLGGAIFNLGTLALTQCTLSGNSASSSGGAITNSRTLSLNNTIVAGNTSPTGPDISNESGTITPTGKNLIGDLAGSTLTANGTTVITGDAKLKPLDNYGGPTQTMQPEAGSPAINAAVGSSFTKDQRGSDMVLTADIGACEASAIDTTTVTSLAAFGPGSLVQSIADAAAIPGPNTIVFLPILDGLTVTVTSEIVVTDTGALASGAKSLADGEIQAAAADDGVTLDASNLPNGFTFSGTGTDRIFSVSAGAKLTLKRITLTGGVKPGIGGGAMFNDGTVSLVNCTLTGNSSGATGGAVRNNGTFTALGCAFLNNTAVNNGGAFSHNAGNATFTNCTFSGNSTTGPNQGGGAISHSTSATSMKLIHCTIAGNSTTGSDGGGGIRNHGPGMELYNCILSGNTAPNGPGPDLTASISLSFVGINFSTTAIHLIPPAEVMSLPPTIQAPQLAPLGNYGGPTQTMPPLPGSPVIDKAFSLLTLSTDQRGLSRTIDGDGDGIGLPDSGAAEYHLILVGTRADENDATATLGSGISLREAVRDITPGGTIGFDPALFDGSTATANTLILTLGPLNPQVNCALNAQTIRGGITVLHQPTIYQQPQSLSLASGTVANFNITVANASGGISTKWRMNGTTLVGFPNPAFSLYLTTTPNLTGIFDVLLGELPAPGTLTLTNVNLTPFSALSQPATLIVGAAPVSLLRQPASAMLPVGGSTTLSVVAAGPPPPQPALKYQWFKAGKAIAGATKSSYAIINAQLTHAGAYSCTVSSGLTTVASSTAEIGVVDTKPKTVNLLLGAKFIPTVLAAGNGLTYQWFRNGGIVPSAARSYTITAVIAQDEGLYTCTVSGLAGTLSNGFNTQLNVLTGPPVLGTIAPPSAVITQTYFYQIPEAAPTTNRKATSFSVTGLPPGLKYDPLTGIISGRPIATRDAGYPVTIRAINLKGSDSEASGIFVIGMPAAGLGSFAGVGARHPLNDNLGARFDLTTTIAGTCSGSVTLGGRAKLPFVNQLLKSFGTSDLVLSAQITGLKMADTTPLSAQVDINLTTFQAQLTLTHPDGTQLVIPAWLQATNAEQYATKYALALDGESISNPAQDNTRPQGYGFNTFTVNKVGGTLTHVGKLPDGTALSGSTFVGLQGQVLVFQMLYANKGSVVGSYTIAPNSLITFNTITGSLSWMKPAQLATSTDTVYKAGFGPLTLTAQGGAYSAPLAGERVLGAASVVAPATNSRLIFSVGGLTDPFTQPVRITNPSATGLTNTAAINAPALNLTTMTVLTASTGAISGSFTFAGPTTAPWFGQIVTVGATPRGYGYFLLPTGIPTVTTSPKLSGRVLLAVP